MDTGRCLLRDKQRWLIIYDNMKDNCAPVLTGRFAIFFFGMDAAKGVAVDVVYFLTVNLKEHT